MNFDIRELAEIGLPHLHRTDAGGLIPNLIMLYKTKKTHTFLLNYVSELMPKGLWEDRGPITTIRGRDAK